LAAIIEDLYRNTGNPDDFNPSKLAKLIGRAEKSSVAVVMVMKRSLDSQIPELEEIEAVACATQNAMLTATAYGLGSFWSSPKFIYSEGCAAAFGFSANDKVLGIMYLGYPAIEWPKSHRKPLEYMSTWVDQ
jgi:nitroreductase